MVSLMINTLDIKAKVMKIHKSNNCVEKIRSYLGNMVDNPRVSGECKIHLTMEINFMLSENYNKGQPIFSESVNIEIMIGSYKNKITNQSFSSVLCRYQMGMETSMERSDSVFESTIKMYYECHRISVNCR